MMDAGPLIAADRRDSQVIAWLDEARRRDAEIRVPAVVVAEVWRPGPRSAGLARVLNFMEVVDVDSRLAKKAGVLLSELPSDSSKPRRRQTVDALVVACAEVSGAFVLTSDPTDLEPLAALVGVQVRAA